MIKHLTVATFILLFSLISFAQETVVLDRETAEKALKAVELNPVLNKQIEDLTLENAKLKAQALPPCQVVINFYTEKMLALPMKASDNSKEENKRIDLIRKDVRKFLLNDIKKTCGLQDSPKWYDTALKVLTPILLIAIRG